MWAWSAMSIHNKQQTHYNYLNLNAYPQSKKKTLWIIRGGASERILANP